MMLSKAQAHGNSCRWQAVSKTHATQYAQAAAATSKQQMTTYAGSSRAQ